MDDEKAILSDGSDDQTGVLGDFEVDRILAHCIQNNKELFLVRWEGYPDYESTWEPPAHLQAETLLQWEEVRTKGEQLDDMQVEELQRLMDVFCETRARRGSHAGHAAVEAFRRSAVQSRSSPPPSPPPPTSPTPSVESRVTTSWTPRPSRHRRRRPQKTQSGARSTTDSRPQQQRFHGIEPEPKRPRVLKSTRPTTPGPSFGGFLHVNDPPRRPRQEPEPSAVRAMPIESFNWSSQTAHNLPARRARVDESPLFFPETDRTNEERRFSEDEAVSTPAFIRPPPVDQPDLHKPQCRPSRAVKLTPSVESDVQSFYTHRSTSERNESALASEGRDQQSHSLARLGSPIQNSTPAPFARNTSIPADCTIKLTFQTQSIGQVLVVGFNFVTRSLVGEPSQQMRDEVPTLGFRDVYPVADYERCAGRIREPPGTVKPYPDNEQAYNDLVDHLAKRRLCAVCVLSDDTERMVFVLRVNKERAALHRLLIEVRQATENDLPRFTALSAPATPTMLPYDRSVSIPETPMMLPLRTGAPANQGSPELVEKEFELEDQRLPISQPPKYMFDFDLEAAMRSFKISSKAENSPYVYIAFAREQPSEAAAVHRWAEEYASRRFVLTNTEPDGDKIKDGWNDFLNLTRGKTDSPILIFFSALKGSYVDMRSFANILYSPNVQCYDVSWGLPDKEPDAPVSLSTSKIFPRGTAMLLTERTMRRYPTASVFALKYFSRHANSAWKVMLRPRIRSWLHQEISTLKQRGDEAVSEEYMAMLGMTYELSGLVDVTDYVAFNEEITKMAKRVFADRNLNDYIVPLPILTDYFVSIMNTDDASVHARDDTLIQHFVGWSVVNAAQHRRFIILDDMIRGDKRFPRHANHIKFRDPVEFMKAEAAKMAQWGKDNVVKQEAEVVVIADDE